MSADEFLSEAEAAVWEANVRAAIGERDPAAVDLSFLAAAALKLLAERRALRAQLDEARAEPERVETTVCEQTGAKSRNGSCPVHNGDACLWNVAGMRDLHNDCVLLRAEVERLRDERDDARSVLASLADRLNVFARVSPVPVGGRLKGWRGVSDDEHRALGIKVSEALDEYHRHYPHQNPHQSARQTAGEGERAGEPEPRS